MTHPGLPGSTVDTGEPVTEHEASPANPARLPGVVLAVIAVAVVAAWWGWPPLLVDVDRAGQPVKTATGMVAVLAALRDRMVVDDPYLGREPLEVAQRQLDELSSEASPRVRFGLLWSVGHHHLRLGENRRATGVLDEALDMVSRIDPPLSAVEREDVLFQVAVAWLRRGEAENCIACHTPESCLLPIRGGGVHQHPGSARRAMAVLMRLLETNPDHAAGRWLLNISAMAVGGFPDEVPERFRMASEVFRSQSEFPRFTNIASRLGLNEVNLSGGSVSEDFNGDGWIDIATSTWDTAGPVRLYQNTGDGRFVERTAESGLSGILGGLNLVPADYDNDGDVDLLVLRGGWLQESGRDHPNSLLQNDGTGVFRDVTFEVGLAGDGLDFPTQTAAWADYDRDGDLDLFVGNEDFAAQLFRNDGGRFQDVAAEAGVAGGGVVKGTAWGDYDNDGDEDLYVSVRGGANRLYRNNGRGRFEDVAKSLGVDGPHRSFPVWFWDCNNDGWLDLYVASYREGVQEVARDYLGQAHESETDALYLGDGEGGFREVAAEFGLVRVTQPMGCNFGDLDNDGWPDFYLGTGYPEYAGIMPNLLFHNRGGTGFADVTFAAGFGHLQKGHGVSLADFDRDGDLDVFQQIGGWYPGDAFGNALFENPGFQRHWLAVRVRGVESNRLGVGARLRVEFSEGDQRRVVHQRIGSGGSFGGNPFTAHIGLGAATIVDRIEVHWPNSGKTDRFTAVGIDRLVECREGSSDILETRWQPVTFVGDEAATDRAGP